MLSVAKYISQGLPRWEFEAQRVVYPEPARPIVLDRAVACVQDLTFEEFAEFLIIQPDLRHASPPSAEVPSILGLRELVIGSMVHTILKSGARTWNGPGLPEGAEAEPLETID